VKEGIRNHGQEAVPAYVLMKPVFQYTHRTFVQTIHKLVQRALPLASLAVGLALRTVGQTPGISDVSVAIHRITIPQIQSYTEVSAFAQDRSGYIWMGTSNGLNRYDGQHCLLFEHDPLDSNSLSDNRILSLLADTSGMLWVGTQRGSTGLTPQQPRGHSIFTTRKTTPA